MNFCMTKQIFFLCIGSILIHYGTCETIQRNSNNTTFKDKRLFIRKIVNKIFNLTFSIVAKEPKAVQEQVLIKVQEKLLNASSELGTNAEKYIDTVMKGVKSMLDKTYKSVRTGGEKFKMRLNRNIELDSTTKIHDRSNKEELISKISHKIEDLAYDIVSKTNSFDEQSIAIDKIRRKLLDSKLINNDTDLKRYITLITKGINKALQKHNQKQTNLMREQISLRSNNNENSDTIESENVIKETTIDNNFSKQLTTEISVCSCNCQVRKLCSDIKSLQRVTCTNGKGDIHVNKLCDGVADCEDVSDEINCITKAKSKIRRSIEVIEELGSVLPYNCFLLEDSVSASAPTKKALRKVLEFQYDFITTYRSNSYFFRNDLKETEIAVPIAANEVAVVVSTVGSALEGAFCTHKASEKEAMDNVLRRFNDVLDDDLEDLVNNYNTWSPLECTCNDIGKCSNKSCSLECGLLCWHRYSIPRWTCEDVSSTKSVSLDVICDGKYDCNDESDETGCMKDLKSTKFEAINIFKSIMDKLTTKLTSKEFELLRHKIITLQSHINLLEKSVITPATKSEDIRLKRDKCFKILKLMYDTFLNKKDVSINEIREVYDFIKAINNDLVKALKKSNIGNNEVISRSSCFCRNGKCATPECTDKCKLACGIETKITRYSCKDSNKSIEVNSLCDNKRDCPNGEDEDNCSKEICRGYHFLLLKKKLESIKDPINSVGEAIKHWKTNAISNTLVISKQDGSKLKLFKNLIENILNDLVMTYANVASNARRKNIDSVEKDFVSDSKDIMDVVKTCGK